jgi:hypothetical protein
VLIELLTAAKADIDQVFGPGHAQANPGLVAAYLFLAAAPAGPQGNVELCAAIDRVTSALAMVRRGA